MFWNGNPIREGAVAVVVEGVRYEESQQWQLALDQWNILSHPPTHMIVRVSYAQQQRELETTLTCWLTRRIPVACCVCQRIMFWLYSQLCKQPYYYQDSGGCWNTDATTTTAPLHPRCSGQTVISLLSSASHCGPVYYRDPLLWVFKQIIIIIRWVHGVSAW